MKRGCKPIKKSEKKGCRRKVLFSPGKNKIEIMASSTLAPKPAVSTGASSAHDVIAAEVDDNGVLTIFLRYLRGQNGTS